MTQLTFDFTATTGFSASGNTYEPNRVASKTRVVQPSIRSANNTPAPRTYLPQTPVAQTPVAQTPVAQTPVVRTPVIRTGQSLSLYENGRQDLQHIGDLAQAVLDRYEIVHRRRAARLAKERAALQAKLFTEIKSARAPDQLVLGKNTFPLLPRRSHSSWTNRSK